MQFNDILIVQHMVAFHGLAVVHSRTPDACRLESLLEIAMDGPGNGRPGITGIGSADVAAATAAGRVIKLIAEARRGPDGTLSASVLPTPVPADAALGRTSGVTNRIEIDGEPVGTVAFSGPGAGGPARAFRSRSDSGRGTAYTAGPLRP